MTQKRDRLFRGIADVVQLVCGRTPELARLMSREDKFMVHQRTMRLA